jgi:long-chain acyl-CoA synthetase
VLPTAHLNTLGELLRDAVACHRSRTALIEVERRTELRELTFSDVETEAEAVAEELIRRGIGAGDRVAILMSNQSRWLTSAIGVFWAGATLVPVDYKLTAPEQAATLVHAEPNVVITEWPVWRELRELWDGESLVAHAPEKEALAAFPTLPAAGFTLPSLSELTRESVACIVYSSGTGGDVKGCMLTHGNYLAQAESLGTLFPMNPGERFFSILPTNHAIDFMTGFLMPLAFGATVIHQRSLRPEFLRFTMKKYRVTHMAAVPRLLRAFEERINEKLDDLEPTKRLLFGGLRKLNEVLTLKQPSHQLSSKLLAPIHAGFGGSLKFVFAGGAFVDPEMARMFYELGIPVVIGYGLTEAGTVLTVNNLKPFRPDTVGPPVDGVELEIRNPNDEGVGEVWVSGPTIMKGYYKNDELTAESIVDGWLRTGDLGRVDVAGHLRLLGRSRNMIVTEGGKNVYPEDIESAFESLAVEELCVFAADYIWPRGAMTGEELMIVVRPKEDGDQSWLADLTKRNRSLAEHKRLHHVLVWSDEFERTASLKVKRRALAEHLRNAASRENLRSLEVA